MKLMTNLSLEKLLILRSRGILIAAVVMIAFAVWGGFVVPYQSAIQSERHLIRVREQIQDQISENEEGITIDLSHTIQLTKDIFQVLHPTAVPNNIMALLAALGPMITAILGAHIVGSEFTNKTVKVRAAHYGWANTVGIKIISIILISAAIAIAGYLIGSIGRNITWSLVTAGPSEIAPHVLPPHIPSPHWQQMLLVMLGLSVYGILGAFMAVAVRSSLAGAIAGLSIPFIERFSLTVLPSFRWLPQNVYNNLLVGTFRYFDAGAVGKPLVLETVSPLWLCWLVLISWILILFFSAWQLSKRQSI